MSSPVRTRSSAVAAALLAVLWLGASAAIGAGVSGVELRVDLPRVGERLQLAVGDEPTPLPLRLENLELEDVTVRLYATDVTVAASGAMALGAAGSAPWIDLGDREVTVPAGDDLVMDVTVDPTRLPAGADSHLAALVVESVDNGATLVTRAAQVVSVVGEKQSPFSGALVSIAVLVLLGTAGLAVRAAAGSRRRAPAPIAA